MIPSTSTVSPQVFAFLKDLHQHNDRDWFQANKHRYEQSHQNMIQFAETLLSEMGGEDHLVEMSGKKSLFRIYRDVRFSKNKAPYKNHWSGQLKRATDQLRGGYYYHLGPNNQSFVAGGFWGPNAEDLRRIRDEIAADAQPLREIIADRRFQELFGGIVGDALKTAPKGFDRAHPDIDLLRYKQFIVQRHFTDEEVLAENFLSEIVSTYLGMRPFFDYMSDVLTTDANGVSIL